MSSSIHVAVGPENSDFGSWNWLGEGLVRALQLPFQTSKFTAGEELPNAAAIVFIKFKPSVQVLTALRRKNCRLVFMPVDVYGSAAEIDGDLEAIRCFDLVIVHSRRLIRYFSAMSKVAYVDHPLKFVLADRKKTWKPGPCLWVGRSCNIPPVVDWANRQSSEFFLRVLTEGNNHDPVSYGFRNPSRVRMETWTHANHIDWLAAASIAVDVKGADFRSRHKPCAKAFDFLASGIPVLTDFGSSVALEMAHRGLKPLFELPRNGESIPEHYIERCASVVQESANPETVWRRMQELFLQLFG